LGEAAELSVAVARVRAVPRPTRRRTWPWYVGGVLFAAVAVVCGLFVGPADLGYSPMASELASHVPFLGVHSRLSETDSAILWQIRAPRVVMGLLVGGLLSIAGATYQGTFRNPLADPYLLGVAAGAGLGATIALIYGAGGAWSNDLLPVASFIGGAAAVVLAYVVGRATGGTARAAALVLAGVTVASFLTAVQTFIQQQHADTLQSVYSWILGRLDTAGWHDVLLLLPYAAVSTFVLLMHRRVLDVLALGDDEAAALGVNVGRLRLLLVAAATLGTAAAVAVSGLIGFLGIIVPHFVRLVAGGSYRVVLPLSLLVGGGFLVFADIIARTVLSPAELPIGVVTAFFGAPFFAIVLRTSRGVTG
jgi:iron complex transport system permease protein